MKIQVVAGGKTPDIDAIGCALNDMARRAQAAVDLIDIELRVQRTTPLLETEASVIYELADACLDFVRNTVGVSVIIRAIEE